MNPNRAGSPFHPIAHDVVAIGANASWIGIQVHQVFFLWRGKKVVSGRPTLRFRIPFHEREIEDPAKVQLVWIAQAGTRANLVSQSRENVVAGSVAVRHETKKVACFRLADLQYQFQLFGFKEFRNATSNGQARRGCVSRFALTALIDRESGQAFCAELLGKILKLAYILAREPGATGISHAAHQSAAFNCVLEHAESAIGHRAGGVENAQTKSKVRFIGSVKMQGFVIREARERLHRHMAGLKFFDELVAYRTR